MPFCVPDRIERVTRIVRANLLLASFFGAFSAVVLPKLFSFLRLHAPKFFLSKDCVPPISELWPCCLPRHVALEPVDFVAGLATLALLLTPWEIARQCSLYLQKKRLRWFLSAIVGVLVLLFFAAWADSFWADRKELLFRTQWNPTLGARAIDYFTAWYFGWGVAWAQLIPAALIAAAGDANKGTARKVRSWVSRGALSRLLWILIVSGSSYELVLEFVLALLGFSQQSVVYKVQKVVGCFAIFLVAAKHTWLLSDTSEVAPSNVSRRSGRYVPQLVRMYRLGVRLLLFSALTLLALSVVMPPDLDVVADPRAQAHSVCPFLSTEELLRAGWVLFVGLAFGELMKITAVATSESVRLWRAALHCQLWVSLPAALALSWNWLQAGAALLLLAKVDSLGLTAPLAEELQNLRGGPVPWLCAACALVGTRSALSLLRENFRNVAHESSGASDKSG